ncbi:hypothetical protein NLI96_g9695 [Meripilus lineatus]|uniref:peptidylprolyl isomerase n=1 Tax=Meripilus lineatus TaxID=2056292 RepID=A0AAD5UV98_9APHY|nr:hypothetical protein NLI96_g9695 [Physisporinus lineatus]
MVRPRVFFDIAVDNAPLGRQVVFFAQYHPSKFQPESYSSFTTTPHPRHAKSSFRALCTGEKGLSPISERPLYYKNSIIHRSIKDFMIQGGGTSSTLSPFTPTSPYSLVADFTKRNGMGGESIYGGPFTDEDLTRPLDSQGLLCMANKGPNTNGSQFFVTLRECPHLNGKHVVFGRIIRGYDEVIEKIAQVSVDEKDRPTIPVVISNCGELVLRAKPQEQPQVAEDTSEKESAPSDSEPRKKRRRRHRSTSPADADDTSKERRRKDKKKKKSKRRRDPSGDNDRDTQQEPEQETEEQYDARLEREEKERLEAARKRELEKIKRSHDDSSQTSHGGIRFKGRGRMKYVDPELHHKSYA